MIRVFKHYIPVSLIALGVCEILVLALSLYIGIELRYRGIGFASINPLEAVPEFATYVLVLYLTMLALGLYDGENCVNLRLTVSRLIVAFVIGFIVLSVIFYIYPDIALWRSIFFISFIIGFFALVLVRIIFVNVVDLNRFKRRVLVLGAGARAKKIELLKKTAVTYGFECVEFIKMGPTETEIPDARVFASVNSFPDFVKEKNIQEIVVALDERRGSLPISQLLSCRIDGVQVTDSSSFLERESGLVDTDNLNPSWLVFSDGFSSSKWDVLAKRFLDVAASMIILIVTLPILLIMMTAIKLTSRGPIFYRQERLGRNEKPFMLYKFRSMIVDAEKDGVPRWAESGDKRITAVGGFLRMTRLDEIPQIYNVLKGDMSFVGPRPERKYFVDDLSQQLPYYRERHGVKPGITGWAQINYRYGASVEDAKQKLQYDLYYIKNFSIFLDLLILVQTASVVIWPNDAH